MSEDERLLEVRRWLKYAREDIPAAEAAISVRDFSPRHACWLA